MTTAVAVTAAVTTGTTRGASYPRLGVLDRTGAVLAELTAAARLAPGSTVVDLGRPSDLRPSSGHVDILVLGPKDCTPSALRHVARWRAAHPPSFVVACVSDAVADAPLVEAGVDALVGPEGDGLQDAVRFWTARREAASSSPAVVEDPALIMTVASATGGCGKTFFATNLAAHLAGLGKRVLLVDLDLQFGEVGAALQVRHPYSLYDGLYQPDGTPLPDRALGEHLNDLVFPHSLGFDVLSAPSEPALSDDVTGDDVRHVLSTVRGPYDVVVVDTPPSLNDIVLSAIDQSDVIAVLTTLDIPSLRNLTSFLEVMQRLQVDERRIKLVLNKVEPEIGLEVSQAQDAFGGRFVAELPAHRGASRSINTGTVVLRSEPESPLVRALSRAFDAVIPPSLLASPTGASGARPRRRLRSLLRRP